MKKLLAIGVILLFLGMTISSSTGLYLEKQSIKSISSGNILYVGGNGTGNYTNIQDAIDDASDGDTVFVYSGVYNESLEINTSICLIGEGKTNTIIKSEFSIEILKNSVLISNFYIKNGMIGITCYPNVSNVVIDNNHIYTYVIGIFLMNSDGNIISNNLIDTSGNFGFYDIILSNSNGNIISENNLSGNNGIDLSYECRNNIISNNTILCKNNGLTLDTSFFNIIAKNNFIKNNLSISFINSSFNLLLGNYWDDWENKLPRPINGTRYSFLMKKTIHWIFFDWRPAQEPYDIEV
ncbi:Periplasmic copper-binding protein (NosD) [Thermoplasmatales archaeon SCGC AB-540-F20]|nr:Periplasmic copper-binding protein (NosD) [Thermoplasmatales archaeon SCGC AB-540-F20]